MAHTERLAELLNSLVEHFDDGEFRTLCFDLDVDYDILPAQGKANKARELLIYLDNRGRIPELITLCQQQRQHVAWCEIERAIEAVSPFKGLPYFDVCDAALFFGREQLTAALVGRLREQGFLAVIGASGSGKSSAIRAGMVPALQRGEPLADTTMPPEGSARWPVYILTPTADPLKSLAARLTCDIESVTAMTTLMDDLAKDSRVLDSYMVRNLLPRHGTGHALLVVDQFEDVFTVCESDARRKAFLDNLLDAATSQSGEDGQSPAKIVIALRADFYRNCADYDEGWARLLSTRQVYVGKMSADETRRAIEEPARRNGWEFETGLVDLILHDAGNEPGALPLLSHALRATWENRRGRVLTLAGYTDAGRVQGAIAKTADAVYGALRPDQKAIARCIFLQLASVSEHTPDTRRRVPLSDLMSSDGDKAAVKAVLETLADARLITVEESGVEVAHEALIREWPQLVTWLHDYRDDLRLHDRLNQATKEWRERKSDESVLYGGTRLQEAAAYAVKPVRVRQLTGDECAFLAASSKREAARWRARYLGQAAGIAIGAALGYALAFAIAFSFNKLAELPAGGVLRWATLQFLAWFPIGSWSGLWIGASLWPCRGNRVGSAVAACAAGGMAGAIGGAVYAVTSNSSVALYAVAGALLGAGLGLGVGLARSRPQRYILVALCVVVAVELASVIMTMTYTDARWPKDKIVIAIAGFVLAACTALGFDLTAVAESKPPSA